MPLVVTTSELHRFSKDRSLCVLTFDIKMLPVYNHTQATQARVRESQNICGPETPAVIAPYWEVLDIRIAHVWLEQALSYTMNVVISATRHQISTSVVRAGT